MGRAANSGFVAPLKSTDGSTPTQKGFGTFTLAALTTYYFPLGGADATVLSAHLGWPSTLVITSATVEDCNLPPASTSGGVSDYDGTACNWIDEDPTTAFVGVKGTGVSQTNGVVAATGDAGGGGCMFHIANTGARRTRIKVVVGATGGDIFCWMHGKA